MIIGHCLLACLGVVFLSALVVDTFAPGKIAESPIWAGTFIAVGMATAAAVIIAHHLTQKTIKGRR
jgi:hypothetical protein